MNVLLSILILSLLTTSWVQFTPKSGDYTFEINNRARYQRQEIEGGYAEIFTIVGENKPSVADYILTVSKLNEDEEYNLEKLSSSVYRENYLSTCGCAITSEKEIQYRNFKAIVYTVRMVKKNGNMAGESVHIAKGKVLYNISFLTAESLVPKFKQEFDHTMNTMQLFK